LGDAVQVSAVLRHVAAARPNWRICYQAEEGKHQVGWGIVANTFAYGDPCPVSHVDAEVQILLFDTWAGWHDRPNTRVSSCLHERFGLSWRAEYGRYQVNVSEEVRAQARRLMPSILGRYVALHYRGDSSPERKNLSHEQAAAICTVIRRVGGCPLLLDWRREWPLHEKRVTPGLHGCAADINCAVISECAAYIGIDSGPSKCASATDAPSLVVWTGHSPIPFHDPADNTTHLIPLGFKGLFPVVDDPKVIAWFVGRYNIRWYDGDPVDEIKRWLMEVLK
jgi:hypothetical protein